MKNYFENVIEQTKLPLRIVDNSLTIGGNSPVDVNFFTHSAELVLQMNGGDNTSLEFETYFNQDLFNDDDINRVIEFFQSFSIIHSDTNSVSKLKLKMGNTFITGFLESYDMQFSSFDNSSKARQVSMRIEMTGVKSSD